MTHRNIPVEFPLLDPLELTTLALVASLIVIITVTLIVSTSTDHRMAPEQFEPIIKSPRIQWSLVALLISLNISLWVKVGMRWLWSG